MNQNKSHFEVKFSQTPEGIQVTTDAFPVCKGIGETEQEALQHLSSQIASFVSQVTKANFDQILQSASYTDIISDPIQNPGSKRRLFSIPAEQGQQIPNGQNIAFKLKSIRAEVHPGDTSETPQEPSMDINELFANEEVTEDEELESMIGDILSVMKNPNPNPNPKENPDSFGFGFPISFN